MLKIFGGALWADRNFWGKKLAVSVLFEIL